MARAMRGIATILMIFLADVLYAQDWKQLDVDQLFERARKEAFDGDRAEARKMMIEILERSPKYSDVRIFLARTYAWDSQRDKAQEELEVVLRDEPNNEDALSAITDVFMWGEKYQQALTTADAGLKLNPNNEDFLYKRASILHELARDQEAVVTLSHLLTIDPGHEKGSGLMRTIKDAGMKYTASLSYGVDLFSRTFDPAHYSSLQLARINKWGSAIVRLNQSYRFNSNGFQPEIDLYPRIANGVYAYLNYGYSSNGLFPQHRTGAEIFTSLPKSLEFSAGVRYLYFNPSGGVAIYTGSIGWYVKNYWLSWRPYITPSGPGTSFSSTLFLRLYGSDAGNYVGVNLGLGFSPDERRIQSGSGLSNDGIYVLKTQRGGLSWQKNLPKNFSFLASLTVVRQELSFDQGEFVFITSADVMLRKKF